jgi:hypothetical protein
MKIFIRCKLYIQYVYRGNSKNIFSTAAAGDKYIRDVFKMPPQRTDGLNPVLQQPKPCSCRERDIRQD